MTESFIQLPDDSTGKKLRTRQRTVGANTVEEQFIICESARVRSGVYACHTGAHLVLAAADAATGLAGRWWLLNPVGSTVLVALRRVELQSQIGSTLATPTSPRLAVERFAFTGAASGATVSAAKLASSHANAAATVRSASTGLTITGGTTTTMFGFLPVAAATGVGANPTSTADWNPDENGMPILAAGEGILLRQLDAGTASDTRRYVTNIVWEEFQVP